MSAPFTRHQYPKYKGVTKDGEADEFMEQFENVAIANKEQSDVDKFRIFPSLLRKSARKWFNHTKSPKADWDELKNSFIERFRSLDFKHIVLKHLGSLERKRKESLQDYEERFKELLDRIPRTGAQVPYSEEQAIMWFLEGLSEDMEAFCRRMGTATLDDVIKSAETYEISNMHRKKRSTKRDSSPRGRKSKKTSKKKRRNKSLSSSSSSSPSSSSSSSSSDSSSSDSSSSRSRTPRKNKKKSKSKKSYIQRYHPTEYVRPALPQQPAKRLMNNTQRQVNLISIEENPEDIAFNENGSWPDEDELVLKVETRNSKHKKDDAKISKDDKKKKKDKESFKKKEKEIKQTSKPKGHPYNPKTCSECRCRKSRSYSRTST
ncbi:hypothetical protein R1sor_000315 [Riccia sorocarpa]|uniref:Retrotransposon gag domain-containing protein n=1 Tax=Riccia sorocarpa TaxID=122646 RepID=A0ABD3GST1_9MARC